jgi:hypothetical protein
LNIQVKNIGSFGSRFGSHRIISYFIFVDSEKIIVNAGYKYSTYASRYIKIGALLMVSLKRCYLLTFFIEWMFISCSGDLVHYGTLAGQVLLEHLYGDYTVNIYKCESR